MAFIATSLSPFAMYVDKPILPKHEIDFTFTSDMNDQIVKEFHSQTFNKSAFLKIILYCYNPQDKILQHVTLKKPIKNRSK